MLVLMSFGVFWEEIVLGFLRLIEFKKGNIIMEFIRRYFFLKYLNEKIILIYIVYIFYIL